jgi:hypothetical protein
MSWNYIPNTLGLYGPTRIVQQPMYVFKFSGSHDFLLRPKFILFSVFNNIEK